MPRLTIIVSSYNRPTGLTQAVTSALRTHSVDCSVVICDDASDNALVEEALGNYRRGLDARVTVLRGREYKPVEKRDEVLTATVLINQALRATDSEFVAYLTDGSAYLPGHIDRLVDYLALHSDVHAAWDQQHLIELGDHGEVTRTRLSTGTPVDSKGWPQLVHEGVAFVDRLKRGNFIDHASVVERRTSLPWTENPRDWWYWDWMRWQALALKGKRFDHVPQLGSVKVSGPWNIGPVLKRGGSVADAMLARR